MHSALLILHGYEAIWHRQGNSGPQFSLLMNLALPCPSMMAESTSGDDKESVTTIPLKRDRYDGGTIMVWGGIASRTPLYLVQGNMTGDNRDNI